MQWLTEQWLADKQWLKDNAVWLESAAALATIAASVLMLWKPLGSLASFCWSRTTRRRKLGPTLSIALADLRFIPIPAESRCVLGKVDNRLITQINMQLHVTNVLEPRMPIRLLNARLLKPRVHHLPAFCYVNTSPPRGGILNDAIPWGETHEISILFQIDCLLQRPGKPLRVQFAVTDQFAKEHRLPPMLLPTFDMTPEKLSPNLYAKCNFTRSGQPGIHFDVIVLAPRAKLKALRQDLNNAGASDSQLWGAFVGQLVSLLYPSPGASFSVGCTPYPEGEIPTEIRGRDPTGTFRDLIFWLIK